jgi:protein-tyrosine phosphatase
MAELDADRVAKHLWQGSLPWEGVDPRQFQTLVLCAMEYQPRGQFPGVTVIHVPMDDSERPTTDAELRGALVAARAVVRALAAGDRVLVTCAAGRNRSGLVSALVLRLLGMPPGRAIAAVRAARGPEALSRPAFVSFVERGRISG